MSVKVTGQGGAGCVAAMSSEAKLSDASSLFRELLGKLELFLRFLRAAGLLQQLREQVVRRAVVGILLNGAAQHAFSRGRLSFLHVGASEQDVRTAVIR